MDVASLIDQFLAWHGRHSSPNTVRFYRQRLARFRERFGKRRFASLKGLEIDEHLHAAGQGQSNSTKRHNAVALTSLQAFALENKLLPKEKRIFDKLEKPAMGKRERVPTAEEIEKLLAAAGKDPAFCLLYRCLCRCGARPGELVGAQISDIDWNPEAPAITREEHKTARKTGRPRVIPIGNKLAPLLREAIGERTEGPIFLDGKGRPWSSSALSAAHRRYRDKAGLDKEIVLYLARHRFGTELIRAGEDIKTVADLMGHASITTTQRYVHRDVRELRGKQDLID